ncbi:MAG: VOC family protein [Rhodospirillales bacterium]|nr:VOC family protein [Rhodospirillales bacterium]
MTQPRVSLSHAGFHVFDMDKMIDFYVRVFGFKVTDRGEDHLVFLGADPKDHHQLIMIGGRNTEKGAVHYGHMAFRVDSLDTLREIYANAKAEKELTDLRTMTHGNAWSVYFQDPEGNTAEAFVDTPWYVQQPFLEPIDLDQSDEEIWKYTEELLSKNETLRPIEEWRKELSEELGLS